MSYSKQEFGISALGLAIPNLALPLTELAIMRSVEPTQYTEVLGCKYMSLCSPEENVVTLATTAAQRALENWKGDISNIGMVVVASESAIDMSRPLSAWVMEKLGLVGNIRSYEVKHACYGGTAAVRQALEWQMSGNARGKSALVICADVAWYDAGHSGEPTQGAGSVAMIIGQPDIAAIAPESFYWSEPKYDFWRPLGHKFPEVNGRLSLTCYIKAVLETFKQLAPQESLGNYLNEFSLLNFHVPFPKMVQKAVKKLGDYCGWEPTATANTMEKRIMPTMLWNQQIGNSYTASLWFAVAYSLTRLNDKEQFSAFSYGSGCGAELLRLQCTHNQLDAGWVKQLELDLSNRQVIDRHQYQTLRDQL